LSPVSVRVTSASGVDLVPAGFLLPALDQVNLSYGGIEVDGGISWQAGAPGVNGAMKYYTA
jgi:hypothetical protein